MCVCERWESERAPIRYFGDLGMLRGVTRGNRPRLSGGLCEEGGSWLQANVLHHDHSIAVHLFHVLLDLTSPWTYHSHFISLSTTVTHIKKKQRAIKLAKPFGRASYIPALWECTLVSIMHSRGCFCDMGSPVLLVYEKHPGDEAGTETLGSDFSLFSFRGVETFSKKIPWLLLVSCHWSTFIML